eukprot:Sspe_Gene.47442::Locus_24168_Transcript_1_1_Confidence_1.000_Length_1885::g.47442::m.47442
MLSMQGVAEGGEREICQCPSGVECSHIVSDRFHTGRWAMGVGCRWYSPAYCCPCVGHATTTWHGASRGGGGCRLRAACNSCNTSSCVGDGVSLGRSPSRLATMCSSLTTTLSPVPSLCCLTRVYTEPIERLDLTDRAELPSKLSSQPNDPESSEVTAESPSIFHPTRRHHPNEVQRL